MLFAQLDQTIEDRFPVAIACKVVVGDEVGGDAGTLVGANQALDVIGAAIARLAPLHVDDRTEAAAKWASASAVKGTDIAQVVADKFPRKIRGRLSFQA